MTNAIVKKLPFGSAPKVDNVTLPTVRSVTDDNKLGEAIGRVGGGAGGVQRLMCSTAFYLGAMAKKDKVTDYDGNTYWEGFYSTHYAASPLTEDSRKQAKSNALVYVTVAKLPWNSLPYAEEMFEHPHGSMNQKATALRKLAKDHKEAAPDDKAWKALLPAKPAEATPTTLAERAEDCYKSLHNIFEKRNITANATLWTAVNSNDELKRRYDAAVAATKSFYEMAETVGKKKGGVKLTAAQKKAAAKAEREGASLN